MKPKVTYKVRLVFFLFCLLGVAVAHFSYYRSSVPRVDVEKFQNQLIQQQHAATNVLARLKNALIRGGVDSLSTFKLDQPDISYYLIKDGQYIFWSANYTDIEDLAFSKPWFWQFFTTSNAHCIACSTQTEYGNLIAIIRIKNNFPFENDQLKNHFSPEFDIDDSYGLSYGSSSDQFAIHDNIGNYLFSLTEPKQITLNKQTGYIGFTFSILAFICFLFIYVGALSGLGRNKLPLQLYVVYTLAASVLLGVILYFKLPSLLFFEAFSSAFEYSAGPFLASAIHLSLLSAFVVASASGFYHYVNFKFSKSTVLATLLLVFLFLFYLLFFYVQKGLVLHSGFMFSMLKFKDISFTSVWFHLIMFSWGISFTLFFFKVHRFVIKLWGTYKTLFVDALIAAILLVPFSVFFPTDLLRLTFFYVLMYGIFYLSFTLLKIKSIFVNSFVWVLGFTMFFISNSIFYTKNKTESKYRIIAENLLINGAVDNDKVTELMLNELDRQLGSDFTLNNALSHLDSTNVLTSYLNENYFRGYWNKFDIQMNVVDATSLLYNQYMSVLSQPSVNKVNKHFYSFNATLSEIAFQGLFPLKTKNGKEAFLFLNFYPRKNFKSYSFPKFLLTSDADIQTRLGIAIARYRGDDLIYNGGDFRFPDQRSVFPTSDKQFYKFTLKDRLYYVYQPDKQNAVVLLELVNYRWFNYAIYFIYTFLVCLFFAVIIVWINLRRQRRFNPQLGLSTRYQVAFIALLMVSFIGVFYVSASYITNGYKKNQLAGIDNKKIYIQNALQGMYYWTQDLSKVNTQDLILDLQELSYMYQTDINVYDNTGRLVGSSQPLIYNKNLMGRQIAPEPFFGESSSINQEEYMGDLRFSTGYTDFLNGDNMQIGFISIPLYVSSEEVRNEIENFLGVVIHIYIIIAMLSVLLSFFIGRQLSAPLKMIENKLKQMRFGHRNEKIDYVQKDEIGQLVLQYNKTIEELERSARLLAQTERESAWRTMARQIAHEINNPLTPMKLTIQQLQRTKLMNDERFDEYFEKSTQTLVEQIDTLSRIAGSFSNFARMPEARLELIDVASKLYSTLQLFISSHETVSFKYEGARSGVVIFADPEQMLQVFTNLIKNALQAIPTGRQGVVSVSIWTESNQVFIRIADNGKGIPFDLQDKIFVPNFTTKSTGMGLGLSITKNIIEVLGGTISFQSVVDEGSVFLISLKPES